MISEFTPAVFLYNGYNPKITMENEIDALKQELPDWVLALALFGLFLLLALAVWLFALRVMRPRYAFVPDHWGSIVLPPIRGLLVWGLILAGVFYGLNSLNWVQSRQHLSALLNNGLSVSWSLLALFTVIRIVNSIGTWYTRRAAIIYPNEAQDLQHRAAVIRKIAVVIVASFGIVYVLESMDIDISPFLTGGAVGGLIIGLALQDTLSNLFAGFFMNIDRPIKEGDLIQLETGEEGLVSEIGWRYTKIRLRTNNLILIPNSKLSQDRIMNLNLPTPATRVRVVCGVAYESDLPHVESVALEVAREVMRNVEGGDTSFEPMVRWMAFGDSAITFTTVLNATDAQAQYLLQSEFIKALHQRFKVEGIEIPFPIRTIVMRSEQN